MRDISELSDIQSESGVIGTLLYHPDYITYSDHLEPRYFFGEENGCIYWAIRELYRQGVSNIDAFNLSGKLQSHKSVWRTIEHYNMPAIQEWFELYRQAARNTVDEYRLLVNTVVTFAFKRDMIKTLNAVEMDCFRRDTDLDKLNNSVYRALDQLTEKYLLQEEVHTLGTEIDSIWQEIVDRRTSDGIYGIPSKYPGFSEYFTYEPGELVVLQAKYKRGKSIFLMNEVVHKLKMGIACLVVDTEMPTRQYVERLLSHLSGIEVRRVKSGSYDEDEAATLDRWRKWLRDQPFIHIYDPNMTLERLYAICKIQKRVLNLGFVCYDYLKSNAISTGDNYNILGQKCDFLKNNIAGELELPVLAACQLNRHGEVADSDKINRYTSVGIKWDYKDQDMILRDGQQCGNAYARIYVNRLGRQMDDDSEDDYIDFNFSGDNATILEAEQHEQQDIF